MSLSTFESPSFSCNPSIQPFLSLSLSQFYAEPLRLSKSIANAQSQLVEHAQSNPDHFLTLFNTLQQSISSSLSPSVADPISQPSQPSTTKQSFPNSLLPTSSPTHDLPPPHIGHSHSHNKDKDKVKVKVKERRDFTVAWEHFHVLERHQSLLSYWLQLPRLCREALQSPNTWESAMYLLSNLERAWSLSDPLDSHHPWLHKLVHACFHHVQHHWVPQLIQILETSDQLDELVTSLRYLKKITPILQKVFPSFNIQTDLPTTTKSILQSDPDVVWISVFLKRRRRCCFRPTITHSSSLTSTSSWSTTSFRSLVDTLETFHAHVHQWVPLFETLFSSSAVPSHRIYLLDTLYQGLQTFFQTMSFNVGVDVDVDESFDRNGFRSVLHRCTLLTSTALSSTTSLLHPSLVFSLGLDPFCVHWIRHTLVGLVRLPGPWTVFSMQRVLKSLDSLFSIYVPVSVLPDIVKELTFVCRCPKEGASVLRAHVVSYWNMFLDELEKKTWDEDHPPGIPVDLNSSPQEDVNKNKLRDNGDEKEIHQKPRKLILNRKALEIQFS